MQDKSFVAVDWGTTSFRLWVLDTTGAIVFATDGPFGMSNLKRGDFGTVLEDSLAKAGVPITLPAVLCGMAGAAQGWCEAPYLSAPTRLDQLGRGAVQVRGSQRDVFILPGVKSLSPANVMRGEETQIAGLLHHDSGFEGTVCLPGTHTKWVKVAGRAIRDFETCMTGEQFAFFSEKSVLSHSMIIEGWHDGAFEQAVEEAIADPVGVPRKFFSIRAKMLVADQTSGVARARLSGLLIGQELMATRPFWTDQRVTLIGASALCALYKTALHKVGVDAAAIESTKMTIAGLSAAFATLKETHHA